MTGRISYAHRDRLVLLLGPKRAFELEAQLLAGSLASVQLLTARIAPLDTMVSLLKCDVPVADAPRGETISVYVIQTVVADMHTNYDVFAVDTALDYVIEHAPEEIAWRMKQIAILQFSWSAA